MKLGVLIVGNRDEGARLQGQLEEIGYAVDYLVSESDEAFARVRQSAPNLVLVDLLSRGRAERLYLGSRIASQLDVPWICFTPSQKTPSIKAARILGPHGYIPEDLNKDALRASIKKAFLKRRCEKALGDNVGWLVKAIRDLSDAVFVTDPKGRIVFMNSKAETIAGMNQEECKMLPLDRGINIWHLPENETQPEAIREAMAEQPSETYYKLSCSLSTTEGKEIPGECTVSPIKDSSSNLVGFFLVVRLGQEKATSDAIARAKREWEQSMDSVPALVALVNSSKKIVRLNVAMAQALGSVPRHALGQSCCLAFGGEGQNHVCLHEMTMRDGKTRSAEVTSQELDRVYQVTVAPYRDLSGNPIGTVHIATDITEMRKSQDELQSSQDGLLKKCQELESTLLAHQQQLSESHSRDEYFSADVLSNMMAIRRLVLSSEQKRRETGDNLLKKLELSVKPLIMQLRVQRLPDVSQALVKALEYHVSQICSQTQPDSRKMRELLTLRESQICDMILSGLSSKEIAEVLNVSDHTISCQRVRIRKKLGLGPGRPRLVEYLRAKKIASDEIA